MNRAHLRLAVFLLCGPLFAGCALSDWVFGALGDKYSGGGPSSFERRDHYHRELEKWNEHDTYGSSRDITAPWHATD